MADDRLRIGDRVITMQMPGIFTVTGQSGPALDIVSDEGVHLRVYESSLRRMDAPPVAVPMPDDDA